MMRFRVRGTSRSQAGMTLLETLGYIVVFAIGINLCVSLLHQSWRLSALHMEALDRMNDLLAVQEAFRKAVRGADAIVEGVGEYRSGPDCVVLRGPAREGGEQYTAFTDMRGDHHLTKMVYAITPDGPELTGVTTYSIALAEIGFEYRGDAPSRAHCVTLVTAVQKDDDERTGPRVEHRVVATPRGHAGVKDALIEGGEPVAPDGEAAL